MKNRIVSCSGKRAALALAVSLWIAGGGVVSAQDTVITGGDWENVYGNHDAGGWTNHNGDPNGNTVTIKGGDFDGEIYGACAGSGNATGNTVTVNDGMFWRAALYGGFSKQGDATGNAVTVSGDRLSCQLSIYGGYAEQGNAAENSVKISGANIWYTICGGVAGGTGNATGNTVTLMGAGAGMATLSVGNDFIGAATDGLGLASNVGADGEGHDRRN